MATKELIERIKSTEDYFEILGVERDAEASEIIKAYRKLALKLHPDKCKEAEGEEAFKKVGTAFGCLKDADSRAHYERYGSEAGQMSTGGGVDPHDLFAQMFREMQTRQGGVGGMNGMGGQSGFHFSSSNGAGFQTFVFNGGGGGGFQQFNSFGRQQRTSARDGGDDNAEGAGPNPFQVPKWLQFILRLVPMPILVPLCIIGVVMAFSYGAVFFMKRLPYFLPVMYIVPSQYKMRAVGLLVVAGMCGVI